MQLVQSMFLIFLLTTLMEFVTVFMRIVWHLRSQKIQAHIHMPRTHHSLPGAILVLLYFFYEVDYFLVIGMALVLSDLAHHIIIMPLLKKYKMDIHMRRSYKIEHYLAEISIFVLFFILVLSLIPLKITIGWR